MVDAYPGIGGFYWDRHSPHVARGEYLLEEDSDCEFGEPALMVGTGVTAVPFNKRWVKSYDTTSGSVPTPGVFITWMRDISAYDAEEFALRGSHHKRRDITLFMRGAVTVKNMGSGQIEPGDTVIPADGGCELMTTTGQYSLGKSLQRIPSLQYGLIFVDPDYEKPTI